ncbi:tetratricopeptide-like helical domain-containing protein [Artemisia annua]|uniref:Tetratricopeptide-like helical domain-containing protein n=1 Tax=Artemisia annua TaxID=35608 RepID=A0A2U1NPF5_ARTAN|nr:tetratricopeptide-like helical domain-containing protein [Artemisia annua]
MRSHRIYTPNDRLNASTQCSNLVCYNSVYEQAGKALKVVEMFSRIEVVQANEFVFASVVRACARMLGVSLGKRIHAQAVVLGYGGVSFVSNSLVSMYMKCGRCSDALAVFMRCCEPNDVAYNAVINGLVENGEVDKVYEMFRRRQIHGYLIRTRLNYDTGVANALVNMYAKCGSVRHSVTIFNQTNFRNLVSCNTLMAGFANHGLGKQAIELFTQMKELHVKPDSVTFTALLSALNHTGGLVNEVDLLGRARRVKVTEEYMEKYSFERDPVVLGCLLPACQVHGELDIGKRTAERFSKIKKVSTSPYVLLSNFYVSESMWDGVAETRKQLKDSLIKKEPGHSLIEVQGLWKSLLLVEFSIRE